MHLVLLCGSAMPERGVAVLKGHCFASPKPQNSPKEAVRMRRGCGSYLEVRGEGFLASFEGP
eukprot:scaffold2639_cov361-Pavlova_lutheri.AAC.12